MGLSEMGIGKAFSETNAISTSVSPKCFVRGCVNNFLKASTCDSRSLEPVSVYQASSVSFSSDQLAFGQWSENERLFFSFLPSLSFVHAQNRRFDCHWRRGPLIIDGGRGDAPERISMMMTAFLDFSAATRQENEGVALCNGNDLGRGREKER